MDARLPHCQWADQNKESFRWIKAYHPLLLLQKDKKEINIAVERAVKEYGEAIRMLGKE